MLRGRLRLCAATVTAISLVLHSQHPNTARRSALISLSMTLSRFARKVAYCTQRNRKLAVWKYHLSIPGPLPHAGDRERSIPFLLPICPRLHGAAGMPVKTHAFLDGHGKSASYIQILHKEDRLPKKNPQEETELVSSTFRMPLRH